MNYRKYDDGQYQDSGKQQAPQLRSPPPRDGSPRSDVAALKGQQRKRSYVPYQDAVYYNNDNSGSYSSEGRYDRDPRDRYDDRRYSEVYERLHRRRRNGTDDAGENQRPMDDRLPLDRYLGRQEYDDDRQPPAPMNGHTNGQEDRKSRRGGDRRSRSSDGSDRSQLSRGRSRRDRGDDRDKNRTQGEARDKKQDRNRSRSNSHSRSRSRSKPRNKPGPDPNTHPKDDPNRPAEGYTALKALKAAAWAGGVEVVRCRMEPGPWSGQKGKRVALAATVGVAIGALRNGRNQASGKMPYAEAAMTGFYAIDFLKRVARHTEFTSSAAKEQEEWNEGEEWKKGREERMRRFANEKR